MEINNILEELKYFSTHSIYIVRGRNEIVKIFIPFRIKVIRDIGVLKKNEVVWVQEIKVTANLETVFIVGESAYYHYHFGQLIE
ncbi:hypothetical protein [Polaribacter aquimarinus]|uniref:Uncharacterized protein n=1 Tax=Polaribacter aquimarinus TaxID=2100726 RepID=A0A2U2JA51_9FLAO|nr:hypothetical protein [Polaribacter aquimarinus]PWG05223.1 hypothetical protein DIS07_08225 [Polaribacter aquimarinus]